MKGDDKMKEEHENQEISKMLKFLANEEMPFSLNYDGINFYVVDSQYKSKTGNLYDALKDFYYNTYYVDTKMTDLDLDIDDKHLEQLMKMANDNNMLLDELIVEILKDALGDMK